MLLKTAKYTKPVATGAGAGLAAGAALGAAPVFVAHKAYKGLMKRMGATAADLADPELLKSFKEDYLKAVPKKALYGLALGTAIGLTPALIHHLNKKRNAK